MTNRPQNQGIQPLRLQEVAARLRISNTTLHELWKENSRYRNPGMPKKFYIGHTPYVLESELDAFILANLKNSQPVD